jgi:2',3'-cyclic-nucleotide 2'-phosphodiesterase (5'-nucleotidase family)
MDSCKSKNYYNYKAEGTKVNVNGNFNSDLEIEKFIPLYRAHIELYLDSILSFYPETLEKIKGKWETNIVLFLAKITFELGNPIFKKRENKSIDICLLNYGGIRSTIPKGYVTIRTSYNVMPFENSLFCWFSGRH